MTERTIPKSGRSPRIGTTECVAWAFLTLALAACAERPPESAFTEGLQSINGTELYVKRMGAGEPIVVVHGGPMLDHGYFLPHLAPLAESYEIVLYDQRLSGRSAPSVDSLSIRLDTLVEDIEALRRELDLGRMHLMAHSWGGLQAMLYAVRYPQNLRSLTLVSPMAASSDLWQEEELTMSERVTPADKEERNAILESEAFANREPEAIRQLLVLSYRALFHDRARVADLTLYVPDDYVDRSAQFARMQRDLFRFDYHDALGGVTIPVLIVYGADEPGAYLGGTALRQRMPHAEFVRIPDAGHFSFVEQPGPFLRTVTEFLGKVR